MNGYNSKWGLAALPLILEEILGPAVSIIDGDDECIAKDTEDDEQKHFKLMNMIYAMEKRIQLGKHGKEPSCVYFSEAIS